MNNFKLIASLFPLLLVVMLLAGNVQAALLDVGPIVPPVVGSNPPNLGHGFPLWYRDTNRVPLQLCTDEAMCLFLRPDTAQPIRFPDNMPDEVFFYSADAQMTTSGGDAHLISGIEGNIAVEENGDVGLISFARIRIRIDTTVAGTYVVTTPYKQFTFNDVPVGVRAINYTEDIGIGENGVFTGALSGNIGPFLYSEGAPFVTATGSYIGDNTARPVRGSTFIDPLTGQPANVFRVEGPAGFTTASTNLFAVTGQLYTEVTPTPLTVDRVTYTREALGTQISGFATTQALSNQRVPSAPFPGNFALTGALSDLQITGSGLSTVPMATNSPGDGKFFGSSGLFQDAGLPDTVTVTNISDIPPTARVVPLVDEVVIDAAMFNPVNKKLTVSASSYDRIGVPALSAYLPGTDSPLGSLVNGQFSVTFPITDNTVNPVKTYNVPPERITVVSAKGGRDVKAVTSLPPGTANTPPTALDDAADVAAGGTAVIDLAANDSDPDQGDLVVRPSVLVLSQGTHGTATAQGDGTVIYAANADFLGQDSFSYTIRDGFGAVSNTAVVTVNILDSVANSAPVAADDLVSTSEDAAVTFGVTGNDSDAENNLLPGSIFFTSLPANGTLRANSNGSVTYTPAANFNGSNSFSYTVNDSLGLVSNQASVTVTVTPVNDRPLAANDAATTSEDTPVTFSVAANDSDLEGSLALNSVAVVLAPANGSVATNPDGTVTYTPSPDFFGSSTFAYTVSDGTDISVPASVTVTVNSVNDAPAAANDVATVPVGTPITINVIGNDTDADGTINAASVAITQQPANGTVTVSAAGTVTYTSNAGFNGLDTFSYTVRDNSGAVSPPATVSVSVTAASNEAVTVLRAQYRASTGEWRVDGAITNPSSTTVRVYVGRDLTGTLLGEAAVVGGTWSFRLNGAAANPQPNATNTVSVQAVPGGGSRLAFPLALR